MNKKRKIKYLVVFFGLLSIFLFLIYFNSFSHIRSAITDKLYGNEEVLNNILIVKIDDESINKIGRWPWNRDVFAKLIEKTKDAKIIGLDLSFFEESENDFLLRKILSSMDNVVLEI